MLALHAGAHTERDSFAKATNIGEKRATTLSRKRHLTTSKINDLSHLTPLEL
jgi:hypothetical protein